MLVTKPTPVSVRVKAAKGSSAASSSPPTPPAEGSVLRLGPTSLLLAKTGICCVHVVSATYFFIAGKFYRMLSTTALSDVLEIYSLTLSPKYFVRIGNVHLVVAALHVGAILLATMPLGYKLLAPERVQQRFRSYGRHAAADVEHRLGATSVNPHRMDSLAVIAVQKYLPKPVRRLGSGVCRLFGVLFARNGFFGVDGNHFETLFLCREIVETALQCHQAYQMSRLLPRVWLNRFYVAMLILNAWSTPVLSRVFRKSIPMQRLLCLLSDILLDFVSAIGVPVVLALGYADQYNTEISDFSNQFWYNDTWLVRIMNDAPIILFGSWVDAISRLVFSLSILTTLSDISEILRPKQATETVHVASTLTTDRNAYRRGRVIHFAHYIMVYFGVAVLAVQLHAETKASPPSCVLEVRPWLVRAPACTLVELNCNTSPSLSGNRSDFSAILDPLDASSLAHLVIRHCPHVEITSRLQAFDSLIGFKLYNSTIATWGADAAITQTHHPRMRFLFLVHTSFPNGTLPEALLASDFPSTLTDVEIIATNLASLPDDLHERWPHGLVLFLEFNRFASFPPVLLQMDVFMLSLAGNNVTTVPREALLMPETFILALSINPLNALPDLGDVSVDAVTTSSFFLDWTNISVLPLWMDEQFLARTTLFLGNSPHCRLAQHGSSDDEVVVEAERLDLYLGRPSVDVADRCRDTMSRFEGFYPLRFDVRADERW